jgi:GR25 family glycosyltransferase involved in LPS biosynthesis
MHVDNGTKGCELSHRRTWEYLAGQASEYSIVLEDDAQPVEGFHTQLEQALAVAPTPIISLYLGTSYPMHWQQRIQLAKSNANAANASWLLSDTLLHAVGVAVRTDLIPAMLDGAPHGMPFDEAVTLWAKVEGHKVGYCWPSLVDHEDSPSVIAKRPDDTERIQPRKAWWCHTRQEWTDRSVNL